MLIRPFSYLFARLCLPYVAACSCDEGRSVFHSNDYLIRVVLMADESLKVEGHTGQYIAKTSKLLDTTEKASYPCAVWKF